MELRNDLGNIIFYYNRLKNKILNFKPEILKEKYERQYSYELKSIENKLYYLKKKFEPGSFKDEKIQEFEQEIED